MILSKNDELSVYQTAGISFLRFAADVEDELGVSDSDELAYGVGAGKSQLLRVVGFAIREAILLTILVELHQVLAYLFEGRLLLD